MKSVIIGVNGGWAHGLAEAYQHIKKGELAAISTRTSELAGLWRQVWRRKAIY